MHALLGFIFAAIVAYAAYRLRALSASGAIAAAIVGTAVFASGGWAYAAVLFAFFIPSAVLSRVGRARKRALVDVGKHGPRDYGQVMANGGIATLCAIASLWKPHYAVAFAGAFAAASADTWATELGTLARQTPRSILTFKPVATGLSGGITVAGTLAQLAGACAVAVVAIAVSSGSFLAVAVAGFLGATLDSVLGASLQQLRYCSACQRECETDPHDCGNSTQLRRGFQWLTNDAVNAACTTAGALTALALTHL